MKTPKRSQVTEFPPAPRSYRAEEQRHHDHQPTSSFGCKPKKGVAEFPPAPRSYLAEEQRHHDHIGSKPKKGRKDPSSNWMCKLSIKADHYVQGIRDHVTTAPRISETVRGKLCLSAKIIQAGGLEKFFKQVFSVKEEERLLNAFQCYLSTTAGPIAGVLFISTMRVAFYSNRSLKLRCPSGESARIPYKVVIPLKRIMSATSSENLNKPNQKYVHIVTTDGFEFWFMGFISYHKSLKHLHKAISELQ